MVNDREITEKIPQTSHCTPIYYMLLLVPLLVLNGLQAEQARRQVSLTVDPIVMLVKVRSNNAVCLLKVYYFDL